MCKAIIIGIMAVYLLKGFNAFSQNQDLIDLSEINLKMDEFRFQYNCLGDALQANPDSVLELYISQKWCYDSLSGFPKDVLRFRNLKVLIIRDSIGTIPDEISQLTNLQVFIIWNGEINYLPESIGKLKNLRYLDFMFSNLSELPDSFCELDNLEFLGLSSNQFKEIPFLLELECVDKLKTVRLYKNLIQYPKNSVIQKKDGSKLHINCGKKRR